MAKVLGFRASVGGGIVAGPLEPTRAEAIRSALVIVKMAQDRSEDVDAAEAWVAGLSEAQIAAAWEALRAQGWTVSERSR